jgi:hypothetical protein
MADQPMASQCPPTTCNTTIYPNWCAYTPFGPGASCTLDVCCPEFSVYAYIPGLAPNVALLAAFTVAMAAHVVIGLIWNQWWFMCCMVAGCLDEILGYTGRIWMNQALWNFRAFMMQVGESTGPSFWVIYCQVLRKSC